MLQDDDQNLDEIEAELLVTEWELDHEILQRRLERRGSDGPVHISSDVPYEHALSVHRTAVGHEPQRCALSAGHHNGDRHLRVCGVGR